MYIENALKKNIGYNFLQNLPLRLKKLDIHAPRMLFSVECLPRNLTHLRLNDYSKYELNNLPETLETLIIQSGYNKSVDLLPKNLKVLFLGDEFNH